MLTGSKYDTIVIGGGPAGSSAAISIALRGATVLLLEEKHMPREKLCGEFITPECFPTLQRLGVMQRMLEAGAQKINRVSLVVTSGKTVETAVAAMSDGGASSAISLSRSRFDQILFDRAREIGVVCLEGFAVSGCNFDDRGMGRVEGLALQEGTRFKFHAPVIIDASGRNSRLMVGKQERVAGRQGSRLYALKAHFTGIEGISDQVELYFFPQGYGGLSPVEDELVNLCFIVGERVLKSAAGDPTRVVDSTLMENRLAKLRLKNARVAGRWYSAGPLTFGPRRLSRDGVIAIGDASGMIDPFTGTGIQIALRTGEMAGEAILETLGSDKPRSSLAVESRRAASPGSSLVESVLACYSGQYEREFHSRMRAAGLLRTVAFSPSTASVVATVLARMPALAGTVLRATRSGRNN